MALASGQLALVETFDSLPRRCGRGTERGNVRCAPRKRSKYNVTNLCLDYLKEKSSVLGRPGALRSCRDGMLVTALEELDAPAVSRSLQHHLYSFQRVERF
jgi:hypothetical protein